MSCEILSKITQSLDKFIAQTGEKDFGWNSASSHTIDPILELYKITSEQKYINFAESFFAVHIDENGALKTSAVNGEAVESFRNAKNLLTLYKITGNQKYLNAAKIIHSDIEKISRTPQNIFYCDDLKQIRLEMFYNIHPFYMGYETLYNRLHGCKDSFAQILWAADNMRDKDTGLYYSAYNTDSANECGINFCLKSVAALFMGLTNILEAMDEQMYYEYRTVQGVLRSLADSLSAWQSECGMFYSEINKPEKPSNYLESSGTLLLTAGYLKAVRLRFLPQRYSAYGIRAFEGAANKCLIEDKGLKLTHISADVEKTPKDCTQKAAMVKEAAQSAELLLACAEILYSK